MDLNEIFFGRFQVDGKEIKLILNDWKEKKFQLNEIENFWKLHSKYEKVH